MPFSAKTIRRLRGLLIGLACAATLVATVWLIEDWRSNRNWIRFVDEQARLGTPISELPPRENVRAEDNFFETPALQNLLFGIEQKSVAKSLRTLSALAVQNNSAEPLEDILKKLPSLPVDSLPKDDPSQLTIARQILAHFSPWESELRALREATRVHPVSQLVYPEPLALKNFNQQLDTISLDDAMGFSRALSLYSQASLSAGQMTDCFENTMVLLRFGSGFCRSPNTLIEMLVGGATVSYALESWRTGIAGHGWTADQLSTVQDHLSGTEKTYADTPSALAMCLLMQRNGMLGTVGKEDSWFLGETTRPWWLPISESAWWRNNFLQAAEKMDWVRAIVSDQPATGFRQQLLAVKQHEQETAKSRSPYATLGKLSLTNLTDVFASAVKLANTRRLALTACALERHYLAHGAYPDSLTALVPAYLSSVPIDVIDGNPLRYRRNDDGTFALYSVGLDGDDDNGRRAPNRTDLEADGDWVW